MEADPFVKSRIKAGGGNRILLECVRGIVLEGYFKKLGICSGVREESAGKFWRNNETFSRITKFGYF